MGMFWRRGRKLGFELKINAFSHAFPEPPKALCPAPNPKKIKKNNRSLTAEKIKNVYWLDIQHIITALKNDLANHILNMRVVYDIYSNSKKLKDKIIERLNVKSDLYMAREYQYIIDAEDAKIKKLQSTKKTFDENYVAAIHEQRFVGQQIVYYIKLRTHLSFSDIENLKSFYIECFPSMVVEIDSICKEGKEMLVKLVFEEEIRAVMSIFGMTLSPDGTFTENIVGLEDED